MGANVSVTEADVKEMKIPSPFSRRELKRLHKRFKKLDADNSGTLTSDEFLAIPGLEQNPLVQRVISVFDTDGNDSVDFREFVSALSIFAGQANHKEKLLFAFKLYDVDGDDLISREDLYSVLKTMVGDNLDDTQLWQLVDRTMFQADKDKDGYLCVQEFCEMVKGSGIEDKLTMDVFSDKEDMH